jgi:hypothetical protein
MGWETENVAGEALAPPLPPLDPWPFTAEGRLYAQIEHELKAAEAVIVVGSLVLQKSARSGLRGPISTLSTL